MSFVSVTTARKSFRNSCDASLLAKRLLSSRGVPIARLVPVTSRPLALDKNRVRIAEDFDAPLPPEIMEGFLGKSVKPRVR